MNGWRERAIAQPGRIVLERPPAAAPRPGQCRWCGASLSDLEVAIAHGRVYCDAREGRDCRAAYRGSYAQGPRQALIAQARDSGQPLACDQCGEILATFTDRGICSGVRQWDAVYRTALVDGGGHTLDNLSARCRGAHDQAVGEHGQEAACAH